MTTTTGGWATVLIPHKCKLLLLLYSTCTHRPHQPCHEWRGEEVFLLVTLLYVCFDDSEERRRLGGWAVVPSPKILYDFHLIKRLLTNYSYPAPSVSRFEGFALHRSLRLPFRVAEGIHALHRSPSPVSRDSRPHRSLRRWKRETEGFCAILSHPKRARERVIMSTTTLACQPLIEKVV
jgi:hypothetical protein